MDDPKFEEMTVDEIEHYLVGLKKRKLEIRELALRAQSVRADKIDIYNLSQKLGFDVAGMSPKTARELLIEARKTSRPGDVVVIPDSTNLAVDLSEAEEIRNG